MSKPKEYVRISITLPNEALEAADRMAASLSRSRSWVIAEAVRRLADSDRYLLPAPAKPTGGELSPGERVRVSEELDRLDNSRPPGPGEQLMCFARYEDYLAWEHRSNGRS